MKKETTIPRQWIVNASSEPPELARFLVRQLHLSVRGARRLLDERRVFVNNRPVWMARHTLRPGDTVTVLLPNSLPPNRPPPTLSVLWESAGLGVVNKPAGLLSVGQESVENRLREERRAPALKVVHRLDRDTTGCLLFAERPELFDAMVAHFRDGRIGKTYHAIVRGKIEGHGTLDLPIEGQRAITRYRVADAHREASHLILRIETGRTHQIRRHLAMIGHPLLGDRQYGTLETVATSHFIPPRPLLHASLLQFPIGSAPSGTSAHVEAPLPADFREALRILNLR